MRVMRAPNRQIDLPFLQREISAEAFDCARFVYDYMLRLCSDTWYRQQTRIGYDETYSALVVLKGMRQYAFLNRSSDADLRRALRELQRDFDAFHAGRASYPRPGRSKTEPAEVGYPVISRCHDCGFFVDATPKSVNWTCPDCGVIHDTAENTARNERAIELAIVANQDIPKTISREPP